MRSWEGMKGIWDMELLIWRMEENSVNELMEEKLLKDERWHERH